MTEGDIRQGILAFIRGTLAYPGTEVTEETDLFEGEVLDSLMLLQLVLHIEKTYAIALTPDDLSSASFAKVPTLGALVFNRIEQRP